LILAEPKIIPHAKKIQARVADLLGVKPNQVGIKAKTPEGMGTDNAAIAHVVVLLERIQEKPSSKTRASKSYPTRRKSGKA
jgi:2-C-methyl-D-erythritol 2,4-cyclodiphosphate synthase